MAFGLLVTHKIEAFTEGHFASGSIAGVPAIRTRRFFAHLQHFDGELAGFLPDYRQSHHFGALLAARQLMSCQQERFGVSLTTIEAFELFLVMHFGVGLQVGLFHSLVVTALTLENLELHIAVCLQR